MNHSQHSVLSQADMPAALSVLPTAILERPSLEDSSENRREEQTESSVNVRVPTTAFSPREANRKVSHK